LVAQLVWDQWVGGSNPLSPTTFKKTCFFKQVFLRLKFMKMRTSEGGRQICREQICISRQRYPEGASIMDDTSKSSLADHFQESPLFYVWSLRDLGAACGAPTWLADDDLSVVFVFLGCLANDKIEMDLVVGEYHSGCTLINDAASQQRLKIRMHSFNIPLNATSNFSD
jgi:hypothetical protein